MAYPATDVASLREELCGAARACGSEVKLRRALAALKETQLPCPGAGGPEVAPSAACPASSPRGILESLGHGLHKAKEIFGSWHLLNWTHHDEAEAFVDPDVKKVLKSLREGSGVFGMDIGGTLAKAAQLLSPGEGHMSPATFGKTGTFHQELSFQLTINEVPHDVHFLSGATFYLELVLKKLRDSIDDDEASERMGNRRIVTAGGGAHRLAQLFMESLTVEVVPFKEMESLVSGLTFLHKHFISVQPHAHLV
ncbi:unnamed protein product [Effrenium voratum]|nr:unnamed protein product [Effrenium voratum]